MKFFIPDRPDSDEIALEEAWQSYLDRTPGAPATSRRIYRMSYSTKGSKFHVEVGQDRIEHQPITGPRGGHRPGSEVERYGRPTGTKVAVIIDAGNVIHVWSYGPPFGGWANPSMVGPTTVTSAEYFDNDSSA